MMRHISLFSSFILMGVSLHVRVGVLVQSFILNKNHPINALTCPCPCPCTHESVGFRIHVPVDGSHDHDHYRYHYRPRLPRAILFSKIGEDDDDDENEIGKDELESLWSLEEEDDDDDDDDDDEIGLQLDLDDEGEIDLLSALQLDFTGEDDDEEQEDHADHDIEDEDDHEVGLLSELQLDSNDGDDSDAVDSDNGCLDLAAEIELDTPPPLSSRKSSKKKKKTSNKNDGGKVAQEANENISTTNRKKNTNSLTKLSESLPPSNQTVGVGRFGYNMTTFQAVYYENQKYFPLNEYVTYRIRLDFCKDYYMEHGDVNVPFRYTVQAYDYGPDGERGDAYDISLGRWMYNLRKRYKKNMEKIPLEFREELDDMGMNWDGVGHGRRPSTFRKRCEELNDFVEAHGHDRVPMEHSKGHRALGFWVERQRVYYRKMIRDYGGESESALEYAVSSSSSSVEEKETAMERIEMLRNAGFNFKALSKRHSVQQLIFDKEWRRMFDLLQDFKSMHGHLNIQSEGDEKHRGALLSWASEQKYQVELLRGSSVLGSSTALKTLFTPKRLQLLSEIGFDLSWKQNNPVPWIDIARIKFDCERVMEIFGTFCMECGKGEITLIEALSMENPNLLMGYTFQQRVRWEHRHREIRDNVAGIEWLLEREELHLEARLNSLGFSWYDDVETSASTLELQKEYEWWDMYHDFKRYGYANGDFDLRSDGKWYSEDLLDWEQEQRINHFKITDEMDDDGKIPCISEFQYSALRAIGFDPQRKHSQELLPNAAGRKPAVLGLEHDFDNDIDELPEDLQLLANSVAGQRIDKAEQLAWLVRYAALRRYYAKDGPGCLSNSSHDDISAQRLILWENNQRKQYHNYVRNRKTTMTKRRKELLDKINFDWKLQRSGGQDEWKEMRSELLDFKAKFGHCFVPAAYPLNVRLGKWVHLQRELYKQARRENNGDIHLSPALSKQKEKDLISIGLDLTMDNLNFGRMAYDVIWMCRLEELAAFKSLHGHCNVPIDYESQYYDLGVWVREQRVLFLRNQEGIPSHLDKRRIDDLEQLGFAWNNETTYQSS